MINLYLDDYNVLSSLPNQFTIGQVDGWVKVTITLQGKDIYTTTLYENNRAAIFYGFKEIIRENMLTRYLSLASLTVTAEHPGGNEVLEDRYIIFCEVNDMDDERDLIWARFLTNRSFYTIPRSGYVVLSFFSDGGEQFTAYADCVFKESDGTIRTYTYTRSIYHYNLPRIYSVWLIPNDIQYAVEREEGGSLGALLSFTFHVGNRAITVYVTDEPYEVDFYFYNSFNVQEHIFIYGTTKLKSTFDRKEAVSQGVSSFYNMSVERKHEVETAPMSIEEAEYFNEFLASPYVYRSLNQDWEPTVLISDITSEISDSAKDLIKMKFSWRYDNNARWIDTNTYPQMFTAPYNDTFK
ncbi:MAG: hypothetical protein J5953_13465 [Prevotella sp.]|nr:hypothetical protein [Prevotella sp.]